jgi:hypothetical protein
MKTTTTTIILLSAICVSGLLLSAAAQPVGQQDQAAPATDASVQTPPGEVPGQLVPGTATAVAPDQTAPEPAAQADTAQVQPAQDQAAQPETGVPDQTAQEQGAMTAPEAVQPGQMQAIPMEPRTITSTIIAPRGGREPQTMATAFTPPAHPIGTNQNDLTMNFVNAPLDQVLSYLSDAAGFIIAQQTQVRGYVTVQGSHITQDEAVNLLNSQLNLNNYAAIRDGRVLTIMTKNEARTGRIPVKMGYDPTNIPNNDEIATWIIPIRFVEARQLVSDLSLFVSPQAMIVANEAGNSIVITDTQANIRHLVEIIQKVDGSAEAETEIRVFPLKYASPVDVASELSSVFPSSNSGSQAPFSFGGRNGGGGRGGGGAFGGGGRGGFGGGANPFAALFGGGNNATQQRIQKATQVTAVADPRIQAVIVTAPKDLMNDIARIMDELDVASDRDQTVQTVQLENADPQQVATVLQSMFSSGNTSRTGNNQNSMLQQRAQNATTTMGSTSSSSGLGTSSSGGGGGGRTGAGGF